MAEIKQTGSLDLRSAKAAKDTAIENSDAINLTPWFSYGPLTTENTGKYWSSESNHYQILDDGWGRFDKENTSSSDEYKDIAILPQDVFELGQEYTFLLEWRNTIATGSTVFYCGSDSAHYQFVQNDENPGIRIDSTTGSSGNDRRFITCTLSASDPNVTRAIYWRARLNPNSSITGEFRLSVYKGRYYGGYKPYVDQSLINGYFNLNNEIDNVRSNATSFCPTSFDTKDPTKWYQVSWMVSDFTKLDDGWYHLETDNTSGSSAASRYIAPKSWDLIEPGETYTILFEIRNFSGPSNTATNSLGYIQEMAGAQFWGNSTVETIGRPNHTNKNTYFYANDISDDGNLTFRMFKVADSAHLGDTQQYDGMCFRYRLYALAGYVTSYDFRISIYPGEYYGGYTPYLINSTYYKILEVEDNAAPKATAIKRTQRIYYRSNSATKPTTPGNATANWVTQTGNNVDATWTTAHLPISDTHKYTYTCEQSETNAGVVSYTTVLLDDTITVIDGGNIITGSIAANKLDVYDATIQKIRADAIDASSLSIGYSQLSNPPSIPSTVAELSDSSNYATTTALTSETNQRKAIYGTCPTAAGTTPKVVTLANYELDNGKIFTVKFTYANTKADKIQLNVNSTGAKDIWAGGAVTGTGNQLLWAAGAEVSFYYDGAEFVVVNEPRSWYGACNTAAATAAKTDTTPVGNVVICRGTKMILAMTNANTNTAPTLNIRSTGAKAIYAGTETTRPLLSNGLSWAAGYTQEFIFDGAAWRIAVSSYSKNYVTVTSDGVKIHMNNDPQNYQHQTATGTTFYVGGKKRSSVIADGLHVYVGDTELETAKFTADGAVIGLSGKNHIEMDYHSLKLIDKESNTFLHVSDLRDSNGVATVTETFVGNGVATAYNLYFIYAILDDSYIVNVSDSSGGTVTKAKDRVTFESPPTDQALITVTYHTQSSKVKAFTFGSRADNSTVGAYSVAMGSNVTSSGAFSFAGGSNTIASGGSSHAEGSSTTASGDNSHAEGLNTTASGYGSHAEGRQSTASGSRSHAEGFNTTASGYCSHAEGCITTANNDYAHAEGYDVTAGGSGSHAEGEQSIASGNYSHTEGSSTTASGDNSHAEGYQTTASGNHSHAQGWFAVASGEASHAEGDQTKAIGIYSHAEGWRTRASGDYSHAEGSYCYTDDNNANESVRVCGECAHAEGDGTHSSGKASHAEGSDTVAKGKASHSEGSNTEAIGEASHAEGDLTHASGNYSHAEGYLTTASGEASHASGVGTKASAYQTVVGKYNTVDNTKLFIVGGGSSNSSTSNAFTVDESGIVDTKNGSIYAMKLLVSRSYSNSNPNPRLVLGAYIDNYSGLMIECTDSQGSVKYTTLYGPFVRNTDYKFNVAITGVDPNVGLVFRSKTFCAYNNAVGTVLADSGAEYKYGRATLKNDGTFMWSYSDEVQITKVYGLK